MDEFRLNFSKMLRYLRISSGFTQQAMASALNLERSSYVYYERGRSLPNLLTLAAIARIFQVPVENFFSPEKYVNTPPPSKRAPKKTAPFPQTVGELTAEEKAMIAKFRAGGAMK